ncbi:MAG TPA: DegT/DnrJ/EryC1/StrS family aminotransferase, partial [Oligoflexia bacterium]|nr:DegT/DnrJ/EryC1/StrS family aminotransferase [Oligoflexia bacterium]
SMLIIDDACQALLSRTAEGRVGLRPGVIGVASFGRGKALCGTGGGAVLWPEERQDCSLHHEVLEHVQACSPALRGSLADCLRSALFWILENPLLYTIPANMPFLKLGGTFPEFGFRRGGISSVQLYQALAQLIDAEERAAGLRGKVKLWAEALSSLKIIHPFTERGFDFDGMISPIRYPVLFPNNEIRDHAFAAMQKAGLGVSKSYPAPLSGYEPLRQFILPNDCPQAEDVAARILTLPVHHYVRPEDIELGAKIIGNLPGVQ